MIESVIAAGKVSLAGLFPNDGEMDARLPIVAYAAGAVELKAFRKRPKLIELDDNPLDTDVPRTLFTFEHYAKRKLVQFTDRDENTITLPYGDFIISTVLPSGEERFGRTHVYSERDAHIHCVEHTHFSEGPNRILGDGWIGFPLVNHHEITMIDQGLSLADKPVGHAIEWTEHDDYCYTPMGDSPRWLSLEKSHVGRDCQVESLYLRLPIFPGSSCKLWSYAPWRRTPILELRSVQEKKRLEVHLGDPIADALVRYLDLGYYDHLTSYLELHSEWLSSLVEPENRDTLSLIAVCYALWKIDSPLDQIEPIINRLSELESTPDSDILIASYYSRISKDQEAANRLLNISQDRLPAFLRGYRLAVYLCGTLTYSSDIDTETLGKLKRLLETLDIMSPAIDYQSPLLCLEKEKLAMCLGSKAETHN